LQSAETRRGALRAIALLCQEADICQLFVEKLGSVLIIVVLETESDPQALLNALNVVMLLLRDTALHPDLEKQGLFEALLAIAENDSEDARVRVMAFVVVRTLCSMSSDNIRGI